MEKTLKVAEVLELNSILTNLSALKKNPIKFCLARNVREFSPILKSFEDDRTELFNKYVSVDENSTPIISDEYKKKASEVQESGNGGVPLEYFDYQSDEKRNEFFLKLNELLEEEVELTIHTEELGRVIKVSDETGVYRDCTVEQVLEDPENHINPLQLTVLMDYFLI